MRPPRRPGSPWRLLVHAYNTGWRERKELPYGKSYEFTNDPDVLARHERTLDRLDAMRPDYLPPFDRNLMQHTLVEGTEFDELVVGRWLHVEQQNEKEWWMNIGGVTVWVTADRDGRPVSVRVYGPDDYDEARPNVQYIHTWTRKNDD